MEWIKINGEKDLPHISKYDFSLFFVMNDEGYITIQSFGRNKKNEWLTYFTHYMPIIKPKPPTK